jgi:hypothetical protein
MHTHPYIYDTYVYMYIYICVYYTLYIIYTLYIYIYESVSELLLKMAMW